MPVGDPGTVFVLVGALPGHLHSDHRLAGPHDRTDDRLDRIGQRRYALPHRTSNMVVNGDAAYFGKPLVDMYIAAVRRQEGKPDRRGVVDQLQRGLFSERQAGQSRGRPARLRLGGSIVGHKMPLCRVPVASALPAFRAYTVSPVLCQRMLPGRGRALGRSYVCFGELIEMRRQCIRTAHD